MKGWKITPSHYLNQDLSVRLDRQVGPGVRAQLALARSGRPCVTGGRPEQCQTQSAAMYLYVFKRCC